tara:strand:+ start:370 stop:1260 length:891 start_codon:yes stop_codon:yes gene_type:complete
MVYIYFIIDYKSSTINFNKLDIDYLLKFKSKHFSQHIKKNDKINLILGSSFVEDSLIPDSLGKKWFSFSNQGQHIIQSFKILNLYKDSVKIDTVLIEVSPFDFKSGYSISQILDKNYKIQLPLNERLKLLQVLKNDTYFNFDHLFYEEKTDKITFSFQDIEYGIWSNQGFSGQFNRPNDQFYTGETGLAKYYYTDVNQPPNMDGFLTFNDFVNKLGIKVFYLISPKSKSYIKEVIINKKDLVWSSILRKIDSCGVDILNYENMKTDAYNFNFFYDEAHLSYLGAKAFTKIIKTKLN